MPSALALEVCPPDSPKLGAPTHFTLALGDEVCRLVRAGYTVRALAAKLGFDDCTIYDWQHAHPDFADQVAQARVFAADAWADKAAHAAEEAMREPGERGERARGCAVMVGNAQWQAERRNAARWGQRSALAIDARITVAGETPLTYAEVMAARATRGARAAAVREERAREDASGTNSLDAAQAGGAANVAASVVASGASASGLPGA